MNLPKILCVVGPTASGKSELAVALAKKYNGEIISADSRQIYRGLNIGSGKVEGNWGKINGKKVFIYKKVPHYLIDEASPLRPYSVAKFQKKGQKIIQDILKRGKLPIICGGSMHWIDALVYNQTLPEVEPNLELRKILNKLSTEELFIKLKKLDPQRAASIDAKNPRRLIRAIEIIKTTGQPVPQNQQESLYDPIWIGLNPGLENLEAKIKKRLDQRFKTGMIFEVKHLHKKLSWQKLEEFGLEYKFIASFLQHKISEAEMKTQLFIAIRQYAKRQMTWWKKNSNIHWFKNNKEIDLKKIL